MTYRSLPEVSCFAFDRGSRCFTAIKEKPLNTGTRGISFLRVKHADLRSNNAKLPLPMIPFDLAVHASSRPPLSQLYNEQKFSRL